MSPLREKFRLLVVDDEPGIRRNLVRALRMSGFTTEEAPDGALASEMIQKTAQPFDLLITDIIMPGIDGFELARLTTRVSPTTKILFMSAYVPNPNQPGIEHLPFLQKPFHLDQFLMTVRELLNSYTPPASFPPIAS